VKGAHFPSDSISTCLVLEGLKRPSCKAWADFATSVEGEDDMTSLSFGFLQIERVPKKSFGSWQL
jgi:hypothetical protein